MTEKRKVRVLLVAKKLFPVIKLVLNQINCLHDCW